MTFKKFIKRIMPLSLEKQFWVSAAIILLSFSIISNYFWRDAAEIREKNILTQLSTQTTKLEKNFTDTIDYTKYLMEYIGRQIDVVGEKNNIEINKIFSSFRLSPEVNEILPWNMYSWIDQDGNLVVNSSKGILDSPIIINDRNYLIYSKQSPWHIFFDKPSFGKVSGNWIIPSAMGITNKNGEYIGTIVFGFNIASTTLKLENILQDPNIAFAIIDNEGQILIEGGGFRMSENKIIQEKFRNLDLNQTDYAILTKYNFFKKDAGYSTIKKFPRYDFFLITAYNHDSISQQINQSILSYIIDSSIVIIISLFLVYMLYKKVGLPIFLYLAKAADNIAKGKTDVFLKKTNIKEIDLLASSLTNIEGLIRSRTTELEKALMVKTEFLNNISHEVRTPVQVITSSAYHLENHWGKMKEDEKYKMIEILSSSCKRLFSLVNNILDNAAIERGEMSFNMQPEDFSEIVAGIWSEYESIMKNKGIKCSLQASNNLWVICDKIRMEQVIRNLIGNAERYTNNQVDIKIFSDDGKAHFAIKDDGPGIPAEELTSIFHPFTQSSRTKTKTGGTGLGLSIVKAIIEYHQGNIWVENNSDNGAIIHFTLDLASLAREKNALADDFLLISNDISNLKIAFVDDEVVWADIMDIGFQTLGLNAKIYNFAIDLLNDIKAGFMPDIIITDLMMPDIDGYELIAALKHDPKTSNIPILTQTGVGSEKEVQDSINIGASSYIRKPYKFEQLIKKIQEMINDTNLIT